MKYFSVNTREFLYTRNEGYYFAALKDIDHLIDEDEEFKFVYRVDLLKYIADDILPELEIKQSKELAKKWFNAVNSYYIGTI